MSNYCDCSEFYSGGGGTVVCGGSGCSDGGGVSTNGGFQRSHDYPLNWPTRGGGGCGGTNRIKDIQMDIEHIN